MHRVRDDLVRTRRLHDEAQVRLLLLAGLQAGQTAPPPTCEMEISISSRDTHQRVMVARAGSSRGWQELESQDGQTWRVIRAGGGQPDSH